MKKTVQIILALANLVFYALGDSSAEFNNDKSSLVFVFDTTGSMYNDLKQLREGAEMILRTALEESEIIEDFVFVPFHDPAVGPATVTRDKAVFKAALNIIRVYGGGDCPEKSLTGIQLALNVSRPRSFVYVFTDATASDHRLVGRVLDLVQRKQSQVVFVLTGHCNDLQRSSYQVYQQIAAASSGQVFSLNKTNVHKVLDFVKSSIKARTVNLGSARNPPGYNYTQGIPVDSTLGEVTVSVSGIKPRIQVFSPTGEQVTGPPQLETTLDLAEIMVVKVLQPEPGNWSITVGSAADHSVQVVGLSNLTFHHGFSVQRPVTAKDTSYRPLRGAYNYMLISMTEVDKDVTISFAEILSLDGKTLFEIPLKQIDSVNKIYLADAFLPPDEFFYIAINGIGENKQELRRVGATAIQAKSPEVPYLTVVKKIKAFSHQSVTLRCDIDSLVPINALWTKDGTRLQQTSSLQSTSIQYEIRDMGEESVGTYRCVARNVAGLSQATTEVELLVEPPVVTITASNTTLFFGDNLTIACTTLTETVLTSYQMIFNGTSYHNVTTISAEPNYKGVYHYNKTILRVTEQDGGVYSCIAAHRGGQTSQSVTITVSSPPTAQILGPHTLPKAINSVIQLICHVESCSEVQWLLNGDIVERRAVNGSYNAMLERTVASDGVWTCLALQGEIKASDSVETIVLMKPKVSIEGIKNITIVNGTEYNITCLVEAKPTPRILWHKETETFLNNTITRIAPNLYKSVLTLNSNNGEVNGTYFCFGENSEGIDQDSVTVLVRRSMTLIQGFSDISTQLYSNVSMRCLVDSYPKAEIKWLHNSTELSNKPTIHRTDDSTISIEKVDFDDLGMYSCEANNGYENLVVNWTLSVNGLENPELAIAPGRMVTRKGNATILTCSVLKGNPKPMLTWQYSNGTSFVPLPNDVEISDSGTQIIISNTKVDHAGSYRCIAENVLGKRFYDVELSVQYAPELKQISNQKPIEVQLGKKISLSCLAMGIPKPIVVWTKDERPLSFTKNIYLTSDSDLVIEKATVHDSGLFSCNASSVLGSTRKNFTLIIYAASEITPPGFEPAVDYLEGQLIELPCVGKGSPRPEVRWLHNGNAVTDDRKYIDDFGIRFVANLTDFGDYTCVVSNKYGNTNVTYAVYIWVPPTIEPPLEVDVNVLVGSNLTLNCDAVGFPIPTLRWEFRDSALVENTTNTRFNEYGNMNITNVTSFYEGQYACIADNMVGVARKNFYVQINEPPVILEDYTGTYIATDMDSLLMVPCKAAGKPKPYVYWMKDNTYLNKDSRYDIDAHGTLTIKKPSPEYSGSYLCKAKNTVGETNKTVAVEIYSLPGKMQADESDSKITLLEGSNVTMECPMTTSASDVVTWYKDANIVSHGFLTFVNVSRDNASQYACVVANAVGSAYAKQWVEVEWPPKFTAEEAEEVEVVRGGDKWLDCGVDARPGAAIKWLFNSKIIPGENKDRLKLINLQLYHTGMYKCVVSNAHGTIARHFSLDVLVPPFISEFDLLDVQLKEGMNASLDCNARGSPKPDVKWTYNNTNWHSDNSTLVAANVSSLSTGLYRCDARNKAGSAHIVYRVAIVAPPSVQELILFEGERGVTVEGSAEIVLGTNIRISCKASGQPIPAIQWIKNGQLLFENREYISYTDLTLTDVRTSHSGMYSCVASNEGGMDERRLKVDVLEPPKIFQTLFKNLNMTEKETKLDVMSGQAFYLQCHPYGNPMPEVYWFKDGLPLRFFDATMVSSDFGEVIQSPQARYDQSGNYTCVARNKIGHTSIVYLVDVLVPPPIPKEASRSVNTRVGRPTTLECPVEGSPPPNVMWIRHPYSDVTNSTRITFSEDNVTLTIHKSEPADSGLYSCVMFNKVGTTEVMYDVTIEKPPSIAGNVGPNNTETRVVPLLRSIVLKCEVDGHPMPKISWLKDTQAVSSGAGNIQQVLGNSLLAIWRLASRDAGQYICVAENAAGAQHRRYNVVARVPGKWTDWAQWSYCNVTCGLGHQARSRSCQYVDDFATIDEKSESDKFVLDQSACRGPGVERRKCHMSPCEESASGWSGWSRWSVCSSPCGAGTQARTRRCRRARCPGDNVQIRKCPDLPKCDWDGESSASGRDENSAEDDIDTENDTYTPEATFEFQTEVVDAEEFYMNTGLPLSVYDVKVTPDPEQGPCELGYRHNNLTQSCDDIDECAMANNQCHSTQACANTAGGYRCGCARGFHALGAGQRCLDINECAQGLDECQYACVNVAGGYVCACPKHLRLHSDRRHCVTVSSYQEPEREYLSAIVEFPAKYKNTRN